MIDFRVIIAEDEPLARARLQRLIRDIDTIKIVAIAENGQQAIDLIRYHRPELVILDINMPNKSGLDVAREMQESLVRQAAIIFTTAYDDYALEAFSVDAAAYLMKPISKESLLDAIEKASGLSRLQAINLQGLPSETIQIKRAATIESVPLNQISYFKALDKIVIACLSSGSESVVSNTLKGLEEKLAPAFVRIHRNTLINVSYLERLYKDDAGHYLAKLKGADEVFSVSRRQVSSLKKVFN